MKRMVALAVLLAGCAGPTTDEIRAPDGTVLGYLTRYANSPDSCAWLTGSILYGPNKKIQDHKVAATPGLTCAAITAGAVVGAAAVHGRSFPKNAGDDIDVEGGDAWAKSRAESESAVKLRGPAPIFDRPNHPVKPNKPVKKGGPH